MLHSCLRVYIYLGIYSYVRVCICARVCVYVCACVCVNMYINQYRTSRDIIGYHQVTCSIMPSIQHRTRGTGGSRIPSYTRSETLVFASYL